MSVKPTFPLIIITARMNHLVIDVGDGCIMSIMTSQHVFIGVPLMRAGS